MMLKKFYHPTLIASLLFASPYLALAQDGGGASEDQDHPLDIRKVNAEMIKEGDVEFANGYTLPSDMRTITYTADQVDNSQIEYFVIDFPPMTEEEREAYNEQREEDEVPDNFVRYVIREQDEIISTKLSPDETRIFSLMDRDEADMAFVWVTPYLTPEEVGADDEGERLAPEENNFMIMMPEPPEDLDEEQSDDGEEVEDDLEGIKEGPYIQDYFVLGDSQTVILYASEERISQPFRFWKASTNELIATPFGKEPVLNGNVSEQTAMTSDRSRLVYTGDMDNDAVFELYSMDTQSGDTVKLNGELPLQGQVIHNSFRISPDESHVIYVATQEKAGQNELYMVPIEGGETRKLSGELSDDGDVTTAGLQFTPDGKHVIFVADAQVDGEYEIFARNLENDGLVTLSQLPMEAEFLTEFEKPHVSPAQISVSPDSSKLLYRVVYPLYPELFEEEYQETVEATEEDPKSASPYYREDLIYRSDFYAVNIDGSENQRVNQAFLNHGTVTGAAFGPDSESVFYLARPDGLHQTLLYHRDLNETYSEPFSREQEDVLSFLFSPDGKHLNYLARLLEEEEDEDDREEREEKLRIDADIQQEAEEALAEKWEKRRQEIAEGDDSLPSLEVEYDDLKDEREDYEEELFERSVELFGYTFGVEGRPAILNPMLQKHGNVYRVSYTPDSKWVFYTAEQDTEIQIELYAMPASEITRAQEMNLQREPQGTEEESDATKVASND